MTWTDNRTPETNRESQLQNSQAWHGEATEHQKMASSENWRAKSILDKQLYLENWQEEAIG